MQLTKGTLLQGGKYQIIRTLGQGGFGITYEAEQVSLSRSVTIKEFFMKEYCNRDSDTSHVSVPSEGSRNLVGRFRSKFIREARMIASLNNPHIVKIHDVFEENDTAYYVMEYLSGGSLKEIIEKAAIPATDAEKHIRQVCSALQYLHTQNILHLDVKPSNILFDKTGNAVLIDFGISKHYDESGGQTSSSPVGISKGYAPLEQYQQGDMVRFTPATDIYSLGATLYSLVTGKVPPEASEIYEDGLPPLDAAIPTNIRAAITAAMQPKRKDRPRSIKEFLALLDSGTNDSNKLDEPASFTEEDTYIVNKVKDPQKTTSKPGGKEKDEGGKMRKSLKIGAFALVGLIVSILLWYSKGLSSSITSEEKTDTTTSIVKEVVNNEHFSNDILGDYLYTGPVDIDGQPDGVGKAVFIKDGQSIGTYYKGPIVHGVFTGDNVYFYYKNKKDGDNIFEGTFKDNLYESGKLTLVSDGSYFIGKFEKTEKGGQPSEGTWYDKNGKELEKVTKK